MVRVRGRMWRLEGTAGGWSQETTGQGGWSHETDGCSQERGGLSQERTTGRWSQERTTDGWSQEWTGQWYVEARVY